MPTRIPYADAMADNMGRDKHEAVQILPNGDGQDNMRSQSFDCTATIENVGRTGVEMEALTAVSVDILTVYYMCKAVDRGMTITYVSLRKSAVEIGHVAGARCVRDKWTPMRRPRLHQCSLPTGTIG